MRLSAAALPALPTGIARFSYDRAAQATGIVHFGIGAFHRAHQAWYTDLAMTAGDRDWMIAGVSLRSGTVAAQMNPQDGLYTLSERSRDGAHSRVIGSVREVTVAPQSPEQVVALLAAPATRIASFTVTEKGYCRAPDGSLDAAQTGEGSLYPFLAKGFARRRAAGLPGLTLLSCDNLAGNGQQLERLLAQYLAPRDADLASWVADACAFPSTMVDRIVPAATNADRAAVEALLGLRDEAAVMTEPFSQWVIEDRFANGRPRWELGGAQLVSDVAPYETAKLRMLNGAHSALAYLGLARGHSFVHQAIADPAIRPLIDRIVREEAAPSLSPAPGQDLAAYAEALLTRFTNPALEHRLAQIAMDGSQKIPQRWLATLAHHQREGCACPAILTALGAWLRHVRGDNGPVDDPSAETLKTAWEQSGESGILDALFGDNGLISVVWKPSANDRDLITASFHRKP